MACRLTGAGLCALVVLITVPWMALGQVEIQPEGTGQPTRFDPESLEIQVEGPRAPAAVGDPIPIRVSLILPPGIQMAGVAPIGTGRLELVDLVSDESPTVEGGKAVQVEMTLTTYRPGTHVIEGFSVQVADVQGRVYERRLPGIEVTVHSLIASENNPALRPEKEGIAVLYRDYTMAWAAGISGALLAMIALGYLIAHYRPRVVVVPPPPPPRPAHEMALEKLDQIAADQLIEQGQFMAFYIRLSETVREYLGNRFGYHALEMTTTETLTWLRGIRLPGGVTHQFVGHLLYECDLVKFAKYLTDPDEQQEALENAYQLVRKTMAPAVREEAVPETTAGGPDGAVSGTAASRPEASVSGTAASRLEASVSGTAASRPDEATPGSRGSSPSDAGDREVP